MENTEIQIATRVGEKLYAQIVDRQQQAKKLTGIEPTISAVVRAMLEAAANRGHKKH